VKGAHAAWALLGEEGVPAKHAKTQLQHSLMDCLATRKAAVSAVDVSLDELILNARAQIAVCMVFGDFGTMDRLVEAVHEAVQALDHAESTQ
jgi:hypothetical protein